MCYGNLDPKLVMRDMDARLKSVACERDSTMRTKPKAQSGAFVRLRVVLAWILRKGLRHV